MLLDDPDRVRTQITGVVAQIGRRPGDVGCPCGCAEATREEGHGEDVHSLGADSEVWRECGGRLDSIWCSGQLEYILNLVYSERFII